MLRKQAVFDREAFLALPDLPPRLKLWGEDRELEDFLTQKAFAIKPLPGSVPRADGEVKIAVVGSGPAGLGSADELIRLGFKVTVFERDDRPGGLLMYGVPNIKLPKAIVLQKIEALQAAGVEFRLQTEIGRDVTFAELQKEFAAIIVCVGSTSPRRLKMINDDARGVYYAKDFLTYVTRAMLQPEAAVPVDAAGKDVVIVGGGDTGNDCVGTCIRHGCKSVTQLEMMPKAPDTRRESNPWPQWPLVCKTDYGQEEAIAVFGHDPRIYTTTVKEFKKDKKGNLEKVVVISLESKVDEKTGRRMMVPVEGTEKELPCELVLIAAGFLGTQKYVTDAFGVELTERTNIKTEEGKFATNAAGVFTAGDCHTGQSLVVKAIRQGRDCAREVDKYLMGYTNL